jgi:hypothetical protein
MLEASFTALLSFEMMGEMQVLKCEVHGPSGAMRVWRRFDGQDAEIANILEFAIKSYKYLKNMPADIPAIREVASVVHPL